MATSQKHATAEPHISDTANQSMAINHIRSGAIIIAGSGMCTGGRIKHHLKHNIWREECQLVIAGFQAMGTPGRALVDGAQHIRLWGETVRAAATVHTIGGLSAHADQAALKNWYSNFEGRPPVVLVHGEIGCTGCNTIIGAVCKGVVPPDRTGVRLRDALTRACRRGVDVRLLLDDVSCEERKTTCKGLKTFFWY